jgi:hypothetical protein
MIAGLLSLLQVSSTNSRCTQQVTDQHNLRKWSILGTGVWPEIAMSGLKLQC